MIDWVCICCANTRQLSSSVHGNVVSMMELLYYSLCRELLGTLATLGNIHGSRTQMTT